MRRENYLIGMLNRGVLALHVSLPGTRRHFMLTKTLEWNLYFCIFDHMFDEHFRLRSNFVHDVAALHWRFKWVHCGLSLVVLLV
jgi:autophagy-related protein 9